MPDSMVSARPAADEAGPPVTPEVVCFGETMALVTTLGERVETATSFLVSTAGAESNVAIGLAHLGHATAWASALGDDALGRRVGAEVGATGVLLDFLRRHPTRRTGLLVKDPAPTGSTVTYYRSDSAASTLGPEDVDRALAAGPRVFHCTGINAALSSTCRAAVEHALARRADTTVSFDVNYRAVLWPSRDAAAAVLRDLATQADIVFVGLDEAAVLWSVETADDVRTLLPTVRHVVVKDGAREAIEFGPGALRTAVPARKIDVVEPVGAGDAFAAGWLHGWLGGEDASVRLRFGHCMAGRTLESASDQPTHPFTPATLRAAITPWPV